MSPPSAIWNLSQTRKFDGIILSQAIRATFERRATSLPAEPPIALTEQFADHPQKQNQWQGFLNQWGLKVEANLSEVILSLKSFLMPICQALISGQSFEQQWLPQGPWFITLEK